MIIVEQTEDYIPPNPFFAAQERLRLDLASRLDALIEVQGAPREDEAVRPLWAIHAEVAKLAGQVEQIDDTLKRLDRDEVDYVTALYAATIDTSGIIVANTKAGNWIIDAWSACKPKSLAPTIRDIAKLRDNRSMLGKFVERLEASARDYNGLAQKMNGRDIRRFISLAQGVCDAIDAEPAPPSSSPGDVASA
ncbi:MAG: hypothetical protein V4564_18330 [Pseudomonadota bacterium]